MRVDGALPPTTWPAAHGVPPRQQSTEDAAAATAAAARPPAATDPASAASRPLRGTAETSGVQPAPSTSPWLERTSQAAGAGRGSASGALGLDVVV
ncbi:hypothetical protein FHN55_19000 [Streptomyces sp. NP160]|uniref:hypothetical protein n=1 Tax=Streptomyces sp. NP160 TaxID=2586637 RepID=UPI001119C7F2|nr:hypothetical protein [Streptomyces sp. NP160]TNM60161.1 hypothetical protein FHN55_19000 [Streptomyces sp. NP160]